MNRYYKVEDVEMFVIFSGVCDGKTCGEVAKALQSLPTIEVSEEDELKFYYVESIDDYWIGKRLDNFYYAKWNSKLGFVWSASRYLPWGEHVVNEQTLWKEHTYPSEPREIPFTEWIVGFMKKYGSEVSEDCISRKWLEEHKKVISYTNEWRETETDEFVSLENIENAPSVVPSRAEGEWIPDPDGGFWCSNCRAKEDEFIYGTGMRYVNGESEFCPNCGAKMKGAEK